MHTLPVQLGTQVYLTNTEVAKSLGISRQSLWRWRTEGRIPAGRQYRGRQVLFTREEVDQIAGYAHRVEPLGPERGPQLGLFNGVNGGERK
jgi:excisionase family DNA binding protein